MNTTAMMYEQSVKSIIVSDLFIFEGESDHFHSQSERTILLCHECAHALITQNSNLFETVSINKLFESKRKSVQEKGHALMAFDEGLACYLSIKAGCEAEEPKIQKEAVKIQSALRDCFRRMISDPLFEFEAKFYGGVPDEYPEVFTRRYEKYPMLLSREGYFTGYRFFDILKPDKTALRQLIHNPPRTARDLMYPKEYLEKINSKPAK